MHFLLQSMHKATNAIHCLGDHCIRRGVGQAHKAGRAEGRAGHDSHKAVRKQKLGEGQIVRDRLVVQRFPDGRADIQQQIERPCSAASAAYWAILFTLPVA